MKIRTLHQATMVKESVMQICRRMQTAKSKESKYLTFTFFEKDHGMGLEVVGWTELRPQLDRPAYVKGVVNPWGCGVPVIDLRVLNGNGTTEMTATTCIVIFECNEDYGYYFGIVVEELSNVMNIAEFSENEMSPLLMSAKRHFSISPVVKN